MAKIHLEIVTPDRKVASVDTDEVIAPGAWGLFGVRPMHAPFMTSVEPGELSFKVDGQLERYAIGGGFVEVSDDKVTVLADTAEVDEDIDLERARKAQNDALARLKELEETDPEWHLENARVKRSAARIRVASVR
jgi:F-type H+-transporting ATPase subunit epsilon